ncbi:MAG TPA: crosslink repair DNA glycosylase YcaQ family protein [Actinomycetes bacterium]
MAPSGERPRRSDPAGRRWRCALPILSRDRLVGRLDVRADRGGGVLRVPAVHQDVRFTTAVATAVDREMPS